MLYEFDSRAPQVGRGTYVSEHAIVIGDVLIGEECYIGHGVVLRGDYGRIEIGSGTAVEEGVIIHAPPGKVCRIGRKVTVGHGAIVHASSVGDFCVIGMGAILSIYSEIGDNTIIAEGGVLKMRETVPGGVVAKGNPIRVVRQISEKDESYWAMVKQLYIDLAKKYLTLGIKEVTPQNPNFPGTSPKK
jgi:carbonic anhydrase/acetyltransferase-like protein (isoleucine patch superfamily)